MTHPDQPNPNGPQNEEVVRLLTEHQNHLLAFIRTSISDLSAAKDILQEVNLTIWRKAADFEVGSNFKAWAFRIAKFQMLSSYRDAQRNVLVYDDEYLDTCAAESEAIAEQWDQEDRLKALEDCLQQLPATQRELLSKRYQSREKVSHLAGTLRQSVSSIKMTLLRARRSLLKCIEKKTQNPSQS